MKKTVIILIGIIYAASIMLVTFYGLITEDAPTDSVPVKSLEIVGEGVSESSGEKHVVLDTPLSRGGSLTYRIQCKLMPENTTNTTVIFESEDPNATVDETGLVTITGYREVGGYNVITVKAYATDDEGNKSTAVTDILNIWYVAE